MLSSEFVGKCFWHGNRAASEAGGRYDLIPDLLTGEGVGRGVGGSGKGLGSVGKLDFVGILV